MENDVEKIIATLKKNNQRRKRAHKKSLPICQNGASRSKKK